MRYVMSLLLTLFSLPALADGATESSGHSGAAFQLILFIVVIVGGYMLLMRPQMKKNREQKQLLANIKKGDEVVTIGGFIGKVVQLGDNFVEVEIAPNVVAKLQRQAVSSLLPKGTIKSA